MPPINEQQHSRILSAFLITQENMAPGFTPRQFEVEYFSQMLNHSVPVIVANSEIERWILVREHGETGNPFDYIYNIIPPEPPATERNTSDGNAVFFDEFQARPSSRTKQVKVVNKFAEENKKFLEKVRKDGYINKKKANPYRGWAHSASLARVFELAEQETSPMAWRTTGSTGSGATNSVNAPF